MNARHNPALAIALMVLATSFIAATTLLAKALGTDALGPALHPFQVTHSRFLFAFVAIAAVTAARGQRISSPRWSIHIGRTLCGVVGVTCMFTAAARIPLSDATAISFLNPVFGMILAIPFLGEKVGPWRWLAAATAFCGALILLRPGPDTFQIAALFALGAAAALGTELIFIKKLADREPILQVLFVNNALGLTISSIAVLFVFAAPTPHQWLALAGLGFAMAAAQACFINAMARADASMVTPFSYLTLVFAALYDATIFGQLPDLVSYLGAAVILAGAALLAWRETVHRSARS